MMRVKDHLLLALSHNFLTSCSDNNLHSINISIHASTLSTSPPGTTEAVLESASVGTTSIFMVTIYTFFLMHAATLGTANNRRMSCQYTDAHTHFILSLLDMASSRHLSADRRQVAFCIYILYFIYIYAYLLFQMRHTCPQDIPSTKCSEYTWEKKNWTRDGVDEH
jgi:hypothetical protein